MSAGRTKDQIRKNVLGSVFLTIFLDLVGFGMFIPVIPLVARRFGASDSEAVAVASLYSLGTLLAVAILGRLSDRMGRKKLLLGTIAVSTVAQILTGLAQTYPVLLAVRFIAGMASGNISVAQACISDVTTPQERGRSMALIGIAFGLGFSFGPAIGALVSLFFPDHSLLGIGMAAAVLNVFNLVVVARRLPETHHGLCGPEMRELMEHVKQSTVTKAQDKTSGVWWQDFRQIIQDKGFRIVLLLGFLQVFGFIGVESVLSLVLNDDYLITEQRQQYYAFMYVGFMLVLVNGGLTRPLIQRLGEVRTLNIGQFLLGLTMIGLPLVAPSLPLLYLFLFTLAAGSGFTNPSISSLTSRLAPQHMQGFALGTSQTLGALARIVGPATFGILYESMGGGRSLFVSAGLMLLGWLVAVFGLQSTHRRFMAEKAAST
ncbi:MFS transporter [Oligoflexus tunisiensis]|uniref:MFS transporter n=1 Tax=Oligoflexus tunisiensis TaxID=708132 RepID=UPI00114CE3B6|nr:MFS transporter [Oligoflexus tunisiensis]